jgi:Transport and Golgi organisation 2
VCTVSVIKVAVAGVAGARAVARVVCSRDELRTRREGSGPVVTRVGGVAAIWPADADGGGTWVAANETGLVLSLLNLNTGVSGEAGHGSRSRGLIIPLLAGCGSIDEAARAAFAINLREYKPFRLLLADSAGRVVTIRWDGRAPERAEAIGPVCVVSSGLGDQLVLPRLELFVEMVARDSTPERQDAFHRHQWPERPEISVLMERADARTVSITTIEIGVAGELPRMVYEPVLMRK